MKGMILLITPSARIKECAATLQSGTGQPVDVAASLQEAGSRLREREYAAVIVDQFLVEAELREDVTAMLLSSDLALAVPGLPISAMEKLRSVHELACHLRTKLSGSE